MMAVTQPEIIKNLMMGLFLQLLPVAAFLAYLGSWRISTPVVLPFSNSSRWLSVPIASKDIRSF